MLPLIIQSYSFVTLNHRSGHYRVPNNFEVLYHFHFHKQNFHWDHQISCKRNPVVCLDIRARLRREFQFQHTNQSPFNVLFITCQQPILNLRIMTFFIFVSYVLGSSSIWICQILNFEYRIFDVVFFRQAQWKNQK